MKKIISTKKISLILVFFLSILVMSCSDLIETIDDLFNNNKTSIIPSNYEGRPITRLGEIHSSTRKVTFYVWDSGIIDGDIITLVFNGNIIIPKNTLRGPNDKISAEVTLTKGYNYVLLFAHNVGSIPPNTAALSFKDGNGEKQLVLSADLQTNGAYDVVLD